MVLSGARLQSKNEWSYNHTPPICPHGVDRQIYFYLCVHFTASNFYIITHYQLVTVILTTKATVSQMKSRILASILLKLS